MGFRLSGKSEALSTKMSEEDWEHALLVFRGMFAAPWPQRVERPADSGGAAFLHGGECAVAGASEGIWRLEPGLEAVLAAEHVRRDCQTRYAVCGIPPLDWEQRLPIAS